MAVTKISVLDPAALPFAPTDVEMGYYLQSANPTMLLMFILAHLAGNAAGLGADQTTVAASRGALVNRSGTIAAGGTAQSVMAANTARKYLFFNNVSDADMWIDFGATAAASQPAIKILPGGSFVMENSFVSTQAVSVFCATTGKAYTAKEA